MGHRQDDPYNESPWGMDTRRHPGEQQWQRDMKGGADERPLYVAPQDQALIDATSADNECSEHERLPGDPSPVCGCFSLEAEGVAVLPIPSAGAFAVVDAADLDRLSQLRWHMAHGYVSAHKGEARVLLHREVMGCRKGDGLVVDHRNGNKLDNRRLNLRIVSRSGNGANRRGADRDARSTHRGVSLGKPRADGTPTWRATAVIDHQQHYLGTFTTEEEAAEAAADFRRLHMPTSEIDVTREVPAQRTCACGCGFASKSRYIAGHNRRGQTIHCDSCNHFVSTPGLCESCREAA